MDLLQAFKHYIQTESLFHQEDHLLVAVSGGVDSIVLAELCRQAGFHFVIAHCNFCLRRAESDLDEAFVRQWSQDRNVDVIVKRFDTQHYAAENKLTIQAAARALRYEWFKEIAGTGNPLSPTDGQVANKKMTVLTAHHADDNVETVLMSFFKGTGIAGLRGILPRQEHVVRPLLFAGKPSIIKFAELHKLSYREDSSNASDKYTRNYFRHQVLPVIEQVYPRASLNITKNISRFRDTEDLYRQAIERHKKNLLEYKGLEVHIPVLKLKTSKPLQTIIYEIIKDYGFSPNQVNDVLSLLDSESGKYIQSAAYRIIKNRSWLIIAPKKAMEAHTILVDKETANIDFEGGNLRFCNRVAGKQALQVEANIAQLDAANIKYPLLLRLKKEGDYFYPLGMKKKKKLNRFLSDLKRTKTEKENTWVLEMNKSIIWVIGTRIDDRFRVTEQTKNLLEITFT